jgi:hypothetical protein
MHENIEVELANLSRDREVAKMVDGMTGNEKIDNLVLECKKHRFESEVRLQKAKNKFFDCCIKDCVDNLRSSEG